MSRRGKLNPSGIDGRAMIMKTVRPLTYRKYDDDAVLHHGSMVSLSRAQVDKNRNGEVCKGTAEQAG